MSVDTLSIAREAELMGDRLEAKLDEFEKSMICWFIGTNLTLAAIILAALKL
jgi:hypothetical protein